LLAGDADTRADGPLSGGRDDRRVMVWAREAGVPVWCERGGV